MLDAGKSDSAVGRLQTGDANVRGSVANPREAVAVGCARRQCGHAARFGDVIALTGLRVANVIGAVVAVGAVFAAACALSREAGVIRSARVPVVA